LCEKCDTRIKVGANGGKNLVHHQAGKGCRKNLRKTKERKTQEKTSVNALKFFGFGAPKVPATVAQPARVHGMASSGTQSALHSPSKSTSPSPPTQNLRHPTAPPSNIPCLTNLYTHIQTIPTTVPEAGTDHPFAQFAGDLSSCVPDGEDAWETWDRPLNTILQKGPEDLKKLVARGDRGLLAFHRFLLYLVTEHNVNSVLFEGKIDRLVKAIQAVSCTTLTAPLQPGPPLSDPATPPIAVPDSVVNAITPGNTPNISIDVDTFPTTQSVPKTASPKKPCPGIVVDIPPGKSALTSYPFALHERLGNPWDISLSGGLLILRARDCSNIPSIHDSKCFQCIDLSKNSTLQGILDRISDGVNENSPFHFHGSGGMIEIMRRKTGQIRALKLNRLGDARKLVRKANAIDLYKEWVMAVGSGKVERVDRLAKVALANNRGIRGLLDLYNRAAHDVYHTKSYDEDDMLRGLLLWRLGGARVADIAHRSLGLPALRTLRRHTVLP